TRQRLSGGCLCPVESPGGRQTIIEQRQPVSRTLTDRVVNQTGDALRAKLQHVLDFEQGEAADANRRVVGQQIGVGQVSFQGGLQRRQGLLVKAEDQFFGRRSAKDFIE